MKPIRLIIYRRQEAEELLTYLERRPDAALDRVRSSLAGQLRQGPRQKRLQPVSIKGVSVRFVSDAPAKKAKRLAEHREVISTIYAAVERRADGRCENPECRAPIHKDAQRLDHFFGRARAESVDTCWMLCLTCDDLKTRNEPDAATWFRRFIVHCREHRLWDAWKKAEALLFKAEVKKEQRERLSRRRP